MDKRTEFSLLLEINSAVSELKAVVAKMKMLEERMAAYGITENHVIRTTADLSDSE